MKRVPWIVIFKLLVNQAAKLEDGAKYRFESGQCSKVGLQEDKEICEHLAVQWEQRGCPAAPFLPVLFAACCFSLGTPTPPDHEVNGGTQKTRWGRHLLLGMLSRMALQEGCKDSPHARDEPCCSLG